MDAQDPAPEVVKTPTVEAVEKAQVTEVSSQTSQEDDGVGEKTIAQIDLDRVGETDAYILDEDLLKAKLGLPQDAVLKKASDGKTVLIPQPTDDPVDPLNWPRWKKSLVLSVIALAAAVPDYAGSTGAVALLPQAQ